MSRYIDYDLIGGLVDVHGNVHYGDIKNIPSADVRENVRGEWLETKEANLWKCSKCGLIIYSENIADKNKFYVFCSKCGASMRG